MEIFCGVGSISFLHRCVDLTNPHRDGRRLSWDSRIVYRTRKLKLSVPPSLSRLRKQRELGGSDSLPALKQCISAFRNLSTIRLVYFPLRGGGSVGDTDWIRPASVLVWNEVKSVAIGQLRGSSVDGPKRLKTITPFLGLRTRVEFEPKLVVEEIVV